MARYISNSNLGFFSSLTAVKPESSEKVVQILWNTLSSTYFPPQEGYKVAIKAPVPVDNTPPDVAVFEIKSIAAAPRDSTDLIERQIFLVECKPPRRDTPGEWAATVHGQLIPCLEAISNPSDRIFAATAIGTKVKFWKWDHNSPNDRLQELHQGVLDLLYNHQRAIIEQWMLHIKANGWAWASQLES